jgi:hypothetical protein
MRSPDWSSTAVFVAWDDWGGFYDHMAPPRVDANGYGLRVPAEAHGDQQGQQQQVREHQLDAEPGGVDDPRHSSRDGQQQEEHHQLPADAEAAAYTDAWCDWETHSRHVPSLGLGHVA